MATLMSTSGFDSAASSAAPGRVRARRDRARAEARGEPWEGSQIYLPPGWPEAVRPPGSPDWERSAEAFLLDCCPPEYRMYAVLRHHPVVLARFAAEFVEAQVRASKSGLADVRSSLSELVDPPVIESAAEAWHAQTAQLVRMRRSVALVEEALRGKVFIQRL